MDITASILLTGAGATLATDLWALARQRLLGIPPPDWSQVGRWLGHMPRGRFRHASIRSAPAVPGERVIGWTAHYLTGVAFAAILPLVWGVAWFGKPTPGPALLVGLVTVLAPMLVMQPGMGAGIAASATPRPWAARLQSVVTHGVFGAGLFLSALVADALFST
jgi:hypothetical protein